MDGRDKKSACYKKISPHTLCLFWSAIEYGFRGNWELWESMNEFIVHLNSKWVRKNEKYANSKWILRNLFCCWVIMTQFLRNQVWKRVWILEARPENGCEKWHFLVWDKLWYLSHSHKIPEITSKHRWQGKNPVQSIFAFFLFIF